VHRQLGARLGAARRLHPAVQHLLLHADHPVSERVVREQVPEVRAEDPVDPLDLVDRMLGHRKPANDCEAATANHFVVDPREVSIEIGMTALLACDVVTRHVGDAHKDRLEGRDVAGREIEGQLVLARDVAPAPRHRALDRVPEDRRQRLDVSHPGSSVG
jgi:hypothetical protein